MLLADSISNTGYITWKICVLIWIRWLLCIKIWCKHCCNFECISPELFYNLNRQSTSNWALMIQNKSSHSALLNRFLISNGSVQNFKRLHSVVFMLHRSAALPPPPQCHVCSSQLIAGRWKDVGGTIRRNTVVKTCPDQNKQNVLSYKYLSKPVQLLTIISKLCCIRVSHNLSSVSVKSYRNQWHICPNHPL